MNREAAQAEVYGKTWHGDAITTTTKNARLNQGSFSIIYHSPPYLN